MFKLNQPAYWFFITVLILSVGCKDDNDIRDVSTVIELAQTAIYSSGSLDGLETFSYDNTAQRFVAGESMVVGDSELSSDIVTTVNIDDLNDNLQASYQKTFYVLFGTFNFSEIIRGNIGYIDGVDGAFDASEPDMLSDRVASTKRFFLYTNPQFLLKKAVANRSSLSLGEDTEVNGTAHYSLDYTDDYGTFNIFIDQASGQINRVQTIDYDYLFGDVVLEVNYSNYSVVNDYSLAENISITYHDLVVYEETRTNIQVNPTFATTLFDFPAGANPVYNATDFTRGAKMSNFHQSWLGIGAPRDGRGINLTATEIVPNVFLLRNERYNSLVVVQENSVTVVDPNLYPDLSESILDWISANYPNKSVEHVISTHHHTDHIDGIRVYVAQGAEVVAASLAEDFYTEIFNATHTIFPDYQISNFNINSVPENGQLTLADANLPIELYQVADNHSEDRLIVYLPTENIIYSTDFYPIGFFDTSVPIPPTVPGALNLYNILVDLGLTTGNIMASGHGIGTMTFEEFEAHVQL